MRAGGSGGRAFATNWRPSALGGIAPGASYRAWQRDFANTMALPNAMALHREKTMLNRKSCGATRRASGTGRNRRGDRRGVLLPVALVAGLAGAALFPGVATAGPLPADTTDVWANGGQGGTTLNSGTTSVPATETDTGTYGTATATAFNDPVTGPGVSVNVGTSITHDSGGVASATMTYYYEVEGPANLTGHLALTDLTAILQTAVNHVGFTVSEAFAEIYGSSASTVSGATPYDPTDSKYLYAAAYSGSSCCDQFAQASYVSSVVLSDMLEVPVNTVEHLTLEAYATNS
ncbi:MAG TPA: hypothetical protein VGG99_08220 [Acetobacteraceae bacterium]|jgi:hypothetical protein